MSKLCCLEQPVCPALELLDLYAGCQDARYARHVSLRVRIVLAVNSVLRYAG